MRANRLRLPALAGVAALMIFLGGCGGYSKWIAESDYLRSAGIVADTNYSLVAAPELRDRTQGQVDGSGDTFLSFGHIEIHGNVATVESARFAVTLHDERIPADITVIVDFPLNKIAWVQKADTAPQARFVLKQDDEYGLYEMKDAKESIWAHNQNNSEKNDAIDTFNKSQGELLAQFATRVVITVTPEIFEKQVLPLQTGKVNG